MTTSIPNQGIYPENMRPKQKMVSTVFVETAFGINLQRRYVTSHIDFTVQVDKIPQKLIESLIPPDAENLPAASQASGLREFCIRKCLLASGEDKTLQERAQALADALAEVGCTYINVYACFAHRDGVRVISELKNCIG